MFKSAEVNLTLIYDPSYDSLIFKNRSISLVIDHRKKIVQLRLASPFGNMIYDKYTMNIKIEDVIPLYTNQKFSTKIKLGKYNYWAAWTDSSYIKRHYIRIKNNAVEFAHIRVSPLLGICQEDLVLKGTTKTGSLDP